ncbi:hypothetical protein Ancab_021246 [Ancistrocladus abbreviatus]
MVINKPVLMGMISKVVLGSILLFLVLLQGVSMVVDSEILGLKMWELNGNRTLMNSYSGQCAVMKRLEDNVPSGGIRSWVATGRKGEVYIAFFNLNTEKMLISTTTTNLARVLPGKRIIGFACKCREVWSGKEYNITGELISVEVEAHGSALFVVSCEF